MESFGTRLAALRKERGLTQDSIADRLNISAQAVSKWENDLTSPDIDTLIKLSDMLDVTLDELMGKIKRDAVVLNDPKDTDLNKLTLRIVVDSNEGDKIRVNLPIVLVKVLLANGDGGRNLLQGKKWAENIDFNAIIELVEQGTIGELVTVDSVDGDHIRIVVE